MAWLIAEHQHILADYYLLYSPAFDTIKTLLDKRALDRACQEAGISTPKSSYPTNQEELVSTAQTVEYPVLLKRITQAFLPAGDKGIVATSLEELTEYYRESIDHSTYAHQLLAEDPEIAWPMVQAYYPESATSIYGVSGFIDRTGELFDMRASLKVLQYPRSLGIGLCFEEAQVDAELQDRLVKLCRAVGYWGVFEAEFIQPSDGSSALLIDFNPRFFHQMQFDIARGMALPVMMYYAAIGNVAKLRMEIEHSRQEGKYSDNRRITDAVLFHIMVLAQRLTGSMHAMEVKQWLNWYYRSGQMHDILADARDPIPALLSTAQMLRHNVRHPRYFLRTFAHNT